MTRTRTLARRSSLAVTLAAVAFGAVALAPAASAETGPADVDGRYTVIEKTKGKGPEAFLTDGTGRTPVFFCDPEKANKRHAVCQIDPSVGPRF